MNGERVAAFLDPRAASREFGPQRHDTLAFLDAQAAEIGEARGGRRERRQHDCGHDAVGQIRAAGIGIAPGSAHDQVEEFLVGLHATRGHGHDCDAAAGRAQQAVRSPEVAGARGVRLDVVDAPVGRKVAHQPARHVDIGQLVLVAARHVDRPSAVRGAEEKSRGELRAFLDADAAGRPRARAGAVDDRGQAVVRRVDSVAEGAQGPNQGRLRALVHAGDAAHAVAAVTEAQERRQEARGRARILDEEVERPLGCAGVGDHSAAALDRQGAVGRLVRIGRHDDAEAQAMEAFHHRLRVLAPQGAAQDDGAARQGGQDQCPVGQALRARQNDRRVGRANGRNDLDQVRQHRMSSRLSRSRARPPERRTTFRGSRSRSPRWPA